MFQVRRLISPGVEPGRAAAASRLPPSSMPPETNKKIVSTEYALDTAARASASRQRPTIMASTML